MISVLSVCLSCHSASLSPSLDGGGWFLKLRPPALTHDGGGNGGVERLAGLEAVYRPHPRFWKGSLFAVVGGYTDSTCSFCDVSNVGTVVWHNASGVLFSWAFCKYVVRCEKDKQKVARQCSQPTWHKGAGGAGT